MIDITLAKDDNEKITLIQNYNNTSNELLKCEQNYNIAFNIYELTMHDYNDKVVHGQNAYNTVTNKDIIAGHVESIKKSLGHVGGGGGGGIP